MRLLPLCWETGMAMRPQQTALVCLEAHQAYSASEKHHWIHWPSSITCTKCYYSSEFRVCCLLPKETLKLGISVILCVWDQAWISELWVMPWFWTNRPVLFPPLSSAKLLWNAAHPDISSSLVLKNQARNCSLHHMVYYELFPWCTCTGKHQCTLFGCSICSHNFYMLGHFQYMHLFQWLQLFDLGVQMRLI